VSESVERNEVESIGEVLLVILIAGAYARFLQHTLLKLFNGRCLTFIFAFWILYCATIILLIYLIRKREGWTLEDFGLTAKNLHKNVVYGTVMATPLLAVSIIVDLL